MDAKNLVVWALEASMHVDPRRPGLTPAELVELGAALGVAADDVHFQIRGRATDGDRILPFGVDPSMFGTYAGDLRTLPAFDHVVSSLNAVHRDAAGGEPWASRETIVAAGEAAGLPRADVEYAVAMYRAFDAIPGADDRWMLRRVKPAAALPSAQRSGPAGVKLTRRERYPELVEALRAVVGRRGGARPGAVSGAAPGAAHAAPAATGAAPGAAQAAPAATATAAAATAAAATAAVPVVATAPVSAVAAPAPESTPHAPPPGDPLAAFGALLPALGQKRLVPWWAQTTREYRAVGDATPLTRCLLAGWMVEAALRIACRHAGIPRPDPKATKPVRLTVPELARAATAIGVDHALRGRIERLAKIRQRIQSNRLLEETGAWTEVSAEEARDASATLDATLGAIVAWQERSGGAR